MKSKPLTYPKTRQGAYEYFYAHGISVRQWAKDLGISYFAVMELLNGRTKGIRGSSHDAAVALGFKPQPKE